MEQKELPKEIVDLIIDFRLEKLDIDPYIFAIEEDSKFSVMWLVNKYIPSKYAIKQIAKKGNLELIIIMIRLYAENKVHYTQKFVKLFNLMVPILAKYGHLEIIKWWLENKERDIDFKSVCYNAALGGNIEVLSWFLDHRHNIDSKAYYGAIEKNNTHVYKWLRRNKIPLDLKTSFIKAIESENLYFMEKLWAYASTLKSCINLIIYCIIIVS